MPLVVPGITQQPDKKPSGDNRPAGDDQAAQQFQKATSANPGPVVPPDVSVFENKPSREEQEARAKELNQK